MDQVIEERNEDGTLLKSYTYGSGIDEVLSTINHQLSTSHYYFYDGLGSVADITDSSGQIIETYIYQDYGKPTIKDNQGNTIPTSAIGNPYMFTGRRLDEETGLYYYRARYYSSSIGRFLQRDPITWGPDDIRTSYQFSPFSRVINFLIFEWGQRSPNLFNMYTYVMNNPIRFIDPYGKDIFLDDIEKIINDLIEIRKYIEWSRGIYNGLDYETSCERKQRLRVEEHLKSLDGNNNGKIDPGEFMPLDNNLKQYDKNGDGILDELEFQNYLNSLKNSQ